MKERDQHCTTHAFVRLRLFMITLVMCLTVVFSQLAESAQEAYSNRLIDSHDPYLQLHAHNPVDWYPWGPEALARAKRENKPIFVSIGYSTCYWCHVAEREIYSNPQIAKLMNQWFINIKVDREERPDLDRIYMLATQVMTGRGAWPNNLFLTPDLKPFFAGSYFPAKDIQGHRGFPKLLTLLHQAWMDKRDRVMTVADEVYRSLQQTEQGATPTADAGSSSKKWLQLAIKESVAGFDDFEGGFGDGVTKFPRSPQLSMLLAVYQQQHQARVLTMVTTTLEAMAEGGLMDQLGGGFHRYSTEPAWSIPHFEKMLYDNAQLLSIYAQAYAVTKTPLFRQVALRTARYLRCEMMASGGGFYSAQDAEVDGVEGASYVWTQKQIESVLGIQEAKRFLALYALTAMPDAAAGHKPPVGGVLRLHAELARKLTQGKRLAGSVQDLAPLRQKLLKVRQQRAQPLRDEKIVTADNALAIIGFAKAGQLLEQQDLLETAAHTADWFWQQAFDPVTGVLKHQFFQDQAGEQGFLSDYALLGRAFMTLYHASGKQLWRSRAQELADTIVLKFIRADGALMATTDTTGLLLAPPVDGDAVKPSGQSAAIGLLLDLASTTDIPAYAFAAYRALARLGPQIVLNPSDWGDLLASLSEPALRVALERAGKADKQRSVASLSSSASYVHAKAKLESRGSTTDLVVKIKIDEGYHINANPATDTYLVATGLLLDGQPKTGVDYPAPTLFKPPFEPKGIAVYQGLVTLRTSLPQTAVLQRPAVSLKIQACNDQVCLTPAILPVPLSR